MILFRLWMKNKSTGICFVRGKLGEDYVDLTICENRCLMCPYKIGPNIIMSYLLNDTKKFISSASAMSKSLFFIKCRTSLIRRGKSGGDIGLFIFLTKWFNMSIIQKKLYQNRQQKNPACGIKFPNAGFFIFILGS